MSRFIRYNGKIYPKFQTTGNSARFIMPVAVELCKGVGYDIGGNRSEWCLPGAIQIDPVINGKDGNNLPETLVDYIFSSHCLEHLNNWVTGLEHWVSRLKPGGLLLLYLPDYSQEYWRPWNNRKHKNIMNPVQIEDLLISLGMTVTVSGVDLNNSFAVMAKKQLHPYGSHIPTFDQIFDQVKIKSVLEFGGGDFSTPYLLDKGCYVHSVEMQDILWYNHIKEKYPKAKVENAIEKDSWKKIRYKARYDIIFVDGDIESRVPCAMWAKDHTDIIVLHDTDAHCYHWERLEMDGWQKYEDTDNEPNTTCYYKNNFLTWT